MKARPRLPGFLFLMGMKMGERSVSVAMDSERQHAVDHWLGHRSYVISGIDAERAAAGRWTSLVMSHRRRHPELSWVWRDKVDDALRRCHESHSFLLASHTTPFGPFLIQAAIRLRVSLLVLELPLLHETLSQWRSRLDRERLKLSSSRPSLTRFWVSPCEEVPDNSSVGQVRRHASDAISLLPSLPLVDRALVALGDLVWVLQVEPRSKTEQLVLRRLDEPRFPKASVVVALEGEGSRSSRARFRLRTQQELLRRGAVGWLSRNAASPQPMACVAADSASIPELRVCQPLSEPATLVPRFFLSPSRVGKMSPWAFLTHCTRGRTGPWPDQSQTGYFDSLLAEEEARLSGTPLETLVRILRQNRLIASEKLNRSGKPTVSFTEVPLADLLERRQYQPHLGRWDWEPYGFCFHRRWIERHGGRPVIYSNAVDWEELCSDDRPFYQPTRDATQPGRVEWEREREWRVVGDIHLAEIPFDSAFVFVPSEKEAKRLSAISRFAIAIFPQPSQPKRKNSAIYEQAER